MRRIAHRTASPRFSAVNQVRLEEVSALFRNCVSGVKSGSVPRNSQLMSGSSQALRIYRLQPPPWEVMGMQRGFLLPMSPFLPVSQERAAARIGILHLLDCCTLSRRWCRYMDLTDPSLSAGGSQLGIEAHAEL